MFFIVIGEVIMDMMNISLHAFQISADWYCFYFPLTMIFGEGKTGRRKHMLKDHKNITIFPIAIPSIASPAAIMGVVILTDNHLYSVAPAGSHYILVLIVLMITYFILLAGKIQERSVNPEFSLSVKVMGLLRIFLQFKHSDGIKNILSFSNYPENLLPFG